MNIPDLLLIIIAAAFAGVLVLYLRKRESGEALNAGMLAREMRDQNANLLQYTQRESAALRQEVAAHLQRTSDNLSLSVRTANDAMNTHLGAMQQQIEAATSEMNKRLDSVTQQMQASTGQVGERLDNAAKVIGEVQKNLGALEQTSVEIKELHELLSAPKLRGGFGEALLEDFLRQVLPAGNYHMQYRFKTNDIVDAVIKTATHLIPIDAKFPYENFKRFASAEDDQERRAFKKDFERDVRKHIDKIASAYILPDEGTFEFALMYIPAENVYYEIIVKDDANGDGKGILNYAAERRVVPVSPNNLFAYLQVIVIGLKGMQIERNAKTIQENLARLQGELNGFHETFETVGRHLVNAKNKYDEAGKQLDKFENKLSLTAAAEDTPPAPAIE